MQTPNSRSLRARFSRLINFLKGSLESWDRVYLCSAAPISAQFLRGSEEAERHHHEW